MEILYAYSAGLGVHKETVDPLFNEETCLARACREDRISVILVLWPRRCPAWWRAVHVRPLGTARCFVLAEEIARERAAVSAFPEKRIHYPGDTLSTLRGS
jgi:hypothetical protein